jgi:hypothetical protein
MEGTVCSLMIDVYPNAEKFHCGMVESFVLIVQSVISFCLGEGTPYLFNSCMIYW